MPPPKGSPAEGQPLGASPLDTRAAVLRREVEAIVGISVDRGAVEAEHCHAVVVGEDVDAVEDAGLAVVGERAAVEVAVQPAEVVDEESQAFLIIEIAGDAQEGIDGDA